jgi:uracil-DNA glycosylase family 4
MNNKSLYNLLAAPEATLVRCGSPPTPIGELRGVLPDGGDLLRMTRNWTLPKLRRCIRECDSCAPPGGRAVPPEGDPVRAEVAFVGHNPGRSEAENGAPFSTGSQSGRMFERYLEALGLPRASVYVTNMAFCRQERRGGLGDVATCSQWKAAELYRLKRVRVIFLLGMDVAGRWLPRGAGSLESYGARYVLEGGSYEWWPRPVDVIPLMHPGFVLRFDPYRPFDHVVGPQLAMIRGMGLWAPAGPPAGTGRFTVCGMNISSKVSFTGRFSLNVEAPLPEGGGPPSEAALVEAALAEINSWGGRQEYYAGDILVTAAYEGWHSSALDGTKQNAAGR